MFLGLQKIRVVIILTSDRKKQKIFYLSSFIKQVFEAYYVSGILLSSGAGCTALKKIHKVLVLTELTFKKKSQ